MPMDRKVMLHPRITPVTNAIRPPPVRVTNTPPHAAIVRTIVRTRWLNQDRTSSSLRKMGNRPNISMEKSVREKTCVVDGNLDASTADAIMAEFVDIDVGNLDYTSANKCRYTNTTLTVCLGPHYNQRTPH
jgi:hypothetical protein